MNFSSIELTAICSLKCFTKRRRIKEDERREVETYRASRASKNSTKAKPLDRPVWWSRGI
jgi:hypothetical protein